MPKYCYNFQDTGECKRANCKYIHVKKAEKKIDGEMIIVDSVLIVDIIILIAFNMNSLEQALDDPMPSAASFQL